MKKKIPLAIRRMLEDVLKNKNLPFHIQYDNYSSIVIFRDLDPDSDFYFDIDQVNLPNVNNDLTYKIQYKPYTEETLEPFTGSIRTEELEYRFNEWHNLLLEFNEDSPIFDDSITQSYYNEIETEFEILDEDADYKPYSIAQQKQITIFLDNARNILENEKSTEAENIIEMVYETKNSISKLTKREVVKKIRKIVARGYKLGIQVGEKLLIQFTTELIKKLIIG